MTSYLSPLAGAALLLAASPVLAQSAAEPAAATTAAAPVSFDAQFQAARALALGGRRDEAIAAYTALLERSPGNADVLLGRGRVYSWQGRWAEAEQDLRAATVQAPTYADAWSALGDQYLWSQHPTEAADAYGHWIELKPDDPAAYVARGRAYRAAGDVAAARADFDAAATHGADPGEVANLQQSLLPRAQAPDVTVPQGFLWSASVGASTTWFAPSRANWSDMTVSIRRHFEHGSLAVEYLGARRFGLDDNAWALDGYVDLWPRAYANLRYQQGPQGTLFPDTSWRAEVFQGVGRGWELSGSIDRLNFASGVDMYGLGVGRYVGNYYLRVRRLYIPGNGSHSTSDRALVRYYYRGDGDTYLEASYGEGRSNQVFTTQPGANASASSSSLGLAWVKFLSPRWGFKLGANYGDEKESYVGTGVSATLYTRW